MEVNGQRRILAGLPPGKAKYPLYRRLDGPPGPVWTGAENLAPTGIRSPDRPARSAVAIPTELSRLLDVKKSKCHSTEIDTVSNVSEGCLITRAISETVTITRLLRITCVGYFVRSYWNEVQWSPTLQKNK